MSKPLIILGAGQFAQVASVYLREAGERIECHVVDDARYRTVEKLNGIGVMVVSIEDIARHFPPRDFDVEAALAALCAELTPAPAPVERNKRATSTLEEA